MAGVRTSQNNSSLQPRRAPLQKRSQQRIQQILDATAGLLDKVGLDDLTTILIAKELGISVGSLYHYFPNKHAILYALGEHWLAEITVVLNDVESWDLAALGNDGFVDQYTEAMLVVYRKQKGVLPLVQAMFAVPELRALDTQHDDLMIASLVRIFQRLGIDESNNELQRLGRAHLEFTHALLLVVASQRGVRAKRTLEDLKAIMRSFLQRS
ncbi:MAG: TetR/AcrR family transcriptional regulator [Pseudomonadales bacterium]